MSGGINMPKRDNNNIHIVEYMPNKDTITIPRKYFVLSNTPQYYARVMGVFFLSSVIHRWSWVYSFYHQFIYVHFSRYNTASIIIQPRVHKVPSCIGA